MIGRAIPAKDGAEFGGGGAETPGGDGTGVVVDEGPEAGLGLPTVEGGVAPVRVPVTLMASFWPKEQCRGTVHVKKCSPGLVIVILAGLPVMGVEEVAVVLQESYAVFDDNSATLCAPFAKLNTRMSPTIKFLLLAQVW